MEKYTQISQQERVAIFDGLKKRLCKAKIARSIDRSKSTIGRELKRNSDSNGYYFYPGEAHALAKGRKARHGYKVERIERLREYVITRLNEYWSPIAIAGRWSLENPDHTITKEAIYAWIYSKQGISLGLPKLLPRAKPKRGKVRARKTKAHIPDRVSIERRPESINQRTELGHLEGDLVFNSGSQSSNVLTLVDRKSRTVMLTKNESKKSRIVVDAMKKVIEKHNAQSVTLDNGSEFTDHSEITREYSIPTFFCDPGAPYQKGSVENMNRMLRRFIPFQLSADKITQEMLDGIAHTLNNTPREILGFRTPLEVQQNIDPVAIPIESRMKRASPAQEAGYNMKSSRVALHL